MPKRFKGFEFPHTYRVYYVAALIDRATLGSSGAYEPLSTVYFDEDSAQRAVGAHRWLAKQDVKRGLLPRKVFDCTAWAIQQGDLLGSLGHPKREDMVANGEPLYLGSWSVRGNNRFYPIAGGFRTEDEVVTYLPFVLAVENMLRVSTADVPDSPPLTEINVSTTSAEIKWGGYHFRPRMSQIVRAAKGRGSG